MPESLSLPSQTERNWLQRHVLGIILVAVAFKQIALALIIPVWQVPDEPAHFQYVQTIVEQKVWPVFTNGPTPYSREVIDSFNAMSKKYQRRIPIFNRQISYATPDSISRRWASARTPRNIAALYGPAYYLYEAVPYLVFYDASIDTRLHAMRIWSSFLLVGLVWVAYRIARRLRGSTGFAGAIALLIGFHPMLGYVSAGVNNDALFNLLGGLMFGLLVIPNLPSKYRTAIWLGLVAGLATLTKQTGWIFIIAAGVRVWWLARAQGVPRVRRLGLAVVTWGTGLVVGTLWSIMNYVSGGNDFVGGTGLAKLTNTVPPTIGNIFSVDLMERTPIVWQRFWGSYGWSGSIIEHQAWVYMALALVSIMALVGIVFGTIVRQAEAEKTGFVPALWIGAGIWCLLDMFFRALYWQHALAFSDYGFPAQGRYYFVVMIPIMLIALYGLDRPWSQTWKPYIWGAVAAAMIIFSAYSMFVVSHWYIFSRPVT